MHTAQQRGTASSLCTALSTGRTCAASLAALSRSYTKSYAIRCIFPRLQEMGTMAAQQSITRRGQHSAADTPDRLWLMALVLLPEPVARERLPLLE